LRQEEKTTANDSLEKLTMKLETTYWFCNDDEVSSFDIPPSSSDVVVFNPEVNLFKLESGDFQVTQMGCFKVILSGPGYILIRRDIAKFLQGTLSNALCEREVTIIRRVTSEEWNNYSEISINEKIEFENYNEFKAEGMQIYTMLGSLIYVSAELKNQLIKHFPDLNGIAFKQGFPLMG